MHYAGYLIDLDGTIYRGNQIIEGAEKFIEKLTEKNIPYLFVTNNAAYTQAQVVAKLKSMGINTNEHNVLTSSLATANYIANEKKDARCFVIGDEGLREALNQKDLIITENDCDYVVVGLDKNVTYQELKVASLIVQQGAKFIITNNDQAVPSEAGLIPANGAISQVITTTTGVHPTVIGKPTERMMQAALNMIGLENDEVLMIGDNYSTDIMAGINANIDTLLVLTGYSTIEEIETVKIKPTHIRDSIKDWENI